MESIWKNLCWISVTRSLRQSLPQPIRRAGLPDVPQLHVWWRQGRHQPASSLWLFCTPCILQLIVVNNNNNNNNKRRKKNNNIIIIIIIIIIVLCSLSLYLSNTILALSSADVGSFLSFLYFWSCLMLTAMSTSLCWTHVLSVNRCLHLSHFPSVLRVTNSSSISSFLMTL